MHGASTDVMEVANGMFGREWKSTTDSVTFDLDTIPEKIRIVQRLKQIEVISKSGGAGDRCEEG